MFTNWSPREIILLVIACTIPMLICLVVISTLIDGAENVDSNTHQTIREIIYMLVGLLAGALSSSAPKKSEAPKKAV